MYVCVCSFSNYIHRTQHHICDAPFINDKPIKLFINFIDVVAQLHVDIVVVIVAYRFEVFSLYERRKLAVMVMHSVRCEIRQLIGGEACKLSVKSFADNIDVPSVNVLHMCIRIIKKRKVPNQHVFTREIHPRSRAAHSLSFPAPNKLTGNCSVPHNIYNNCICTKRNDDILGMTHTHTYKTLDVGILSHRDLRSGKSL